MRIAFPVSDLKKFEMKTMKHLLHQDHQKQKIPVVTISLGVLAFILFLSKENSGFLQYDRTAIAKGEIWRLLTSHWIHWSFEHFLWCTITFLCLGAICEHFSRKGYVAVLCISSLLIPLALWGAAPEMVIYRGLSGLASGLFVFGAIMLMKKMHEERNPSGFFLVAFSVAAFIGKILFEYINDAALFVNRGDLFVPVPLAHLVGGAVGLMMFVISLHGGKGRWEYQGCKLIKKS